MLPLESLFEIVDDKRDVRNASDKLRNDAIGLEAHPLYAIWTGVESADMNTQPVEMLFVSPNRCVRNPDMVVMPAKLSRCSGRFVIPALPDHLCSRLRQAFFQSLGSISAKASADVTTGMTSKSIRSCHRDIHSSRTWWSWHCMI